jgi:hypothetical protein
MLLHLTEKSERKINIRISRFKQRYNIPIDIKRTGWEIMEQVPLCHGRVKWQFLVDTKFYFRISENEGNTFTSKANIVLSIKTPAMQMFPLLCI